LLSSDAGALRPIVLFVQDTLGNWRTALGRLLARALFDPALDVSGLSDLSGLQLSDKFLCYRPAHRRLAQQIAAKERPVGDFVLVGIYKMGQNLVLEVAERFRENDIMADEPSLDGLFRRLLAVIHARRVERIFFENKQAGYAQIVVRFSQPSKNQTLFGLIHPI